MRKEEQINVRMIGQENSRLLYWWRMLLKSAIWDSGDFELKLKKVKFNFLIEDVIRSIEFK